MACEKYQYASKQAAIDFLKEVARSKYFSRAKKKPVQVYHCDECKAWHITSNKPKPHLPRSITKELHTLEIKRPRPLFIIDLTFQRLSNTMRRSYVLLLALACTLALTASGFSDSRVKKTQPDQVVEFQDISYDFSATSFSADVEFDVPAIFILITPELGKPEQAESITREKFSIKDLPVIRPPPDNWLRQKSDYNNQSRK